MPAIDATNAANSSTSALFGAADSAAAAAKTKNELGAADRFLKLLVAQMKNQDPLNPLDNAQVTSQMAQISTVSGIEKLNTTMAGMTGSFSQLQTMQGAALVGHDVLLEGQGLTLDANGSTSAGFELGASADNVRVDILSGAGAVLDTINMGAEGAGRHAFNYTVKAGIDPNNVASFRVSATSGTLPVASTPLMHDRVQAVVTGGPQLTLELMNSGNVPYAQIKVFN